MRPEPIGPRKVFGAPVDAPPAHASMRPEPIGPRKIFTRVWDDGTRIASMRPEPIGPRKALRTAPIAVPCYRFNEAGANWPQKAARAGPPLESYQASMRPEPIGPRKWLMVKRPAIIIRFASMRPEPIGPRKANQSYIWQYSPQSFNEAGANWPQKGRSTWRRMRFSAIASMRPEPIGPRKGRSAILFTLPHLRSLLRVVKMRDGQ